MNYKQLMATINSDIRLYCTFIRLNCKLHNHNHHHHYHNHQHHHHYHHHYHRHNHHHYYYHDKLHKSCYYDNISIC